MAFRRNGVGKLGLNRQQANQELFRKKGESIEAQQLKDLQEQMNQFQLKLKEFAIKYKSQIRKDPEFRVYFQKMCTEVGVDPLQSSKGFWAELLGVGDFYYELGIQIIQICLESRPLNGGLMELESIKFKINQIRTLPAGQNISDDDLTRAIKTLKPLGDHFKLIEIGGKVLVSSVPKELNSDQLLALSLGQESGYLTFNMLQSQLGWERNRINNILVTLLQDELCWIDEQTHQTQYWISSFF